MEFGLPVCPLDRPPEAEGDLMLIIQINWANLPSNCKPHLIMFKVELNPPFFWTPLGGSTSGKTWTPPFLKIDLIDYHIAWLFAWLSFRFAKNPYSILILCY